MVGIFLLWCAAARAADPVTAQLYRGNTLAALQTAQDRAREAPADLDRQEVYLDLLLATGQVDRARRETQEAVRTRPTDPDAHYLAGRAEVDAAAASAAYLRALRLDPDHARSHMGMGAVHTAQGRLDEARAAYTEALRRDGTLGEAWLGLVRVMALQQAPRARTLDLARRGMAAAPDEPGLVLAVATLDPAHAREVLEEAAGRLEDARISTRLAELLLAAGEPEAAARRAERALAIDPGNPEAERTRVFARTLAGGALDLDGLAALLDARDTLAEDPAAATRALEDLAERYPAAAVVFLARAEAWDRAGRPDLALESLALTLQRDPGLVDAQATFGLALLREDRPGEAVPWLARAVAARPWDPDLVRSLGLAQRRAGDLDAARATLEGAHRARPWDVPTLLAYGEVLQATGAAQAAYGLIRDALRQRADPRLAAGFVVAARAAGHQGVAADFLEDLGRRSGSARLLELAASIRAEGPG